ncbi:unnamed protein product [Prorocentrum cordatum]|uniref:Tyrosine-protein kinase ephrin type A/B receptor-like domain-containing protein n=1 Tax=Prorocentrum cordatum TaxID=2364126 RepID=A0ABN9Y3W1_9DINO|nr:unnamed protein product [Polarella glacialis]
MPCLAGSVTSVQGMEECELCAVGTYQSETGQDTCDECPTDQITSEWAIVAGAYKWVPVRGAQNASSCGCNQGFREVDGECVECGDSSITGLVCGGKDDVMVAAGFYAADDSFSVFKCHGAAGKCVGGEAGSTCAAGRRGTACAFCWEGYSRRCAFPARSVPFSPEEAQTAPRRHDNIRAHVENTQDRTRACDCKFPCSVVRETQHSAA